GQLVMLCDVRFVVGNAQRRGAYNSGYAGGFFWPAGQLVMLCDVRFVVGNAQRRGAYNSGYAGGFFWP
ncbi:hypothetical protein BVH78_11950, partial [Corynebacterium diphtheriae]